MVAQIAHPFHDFLFCTSHQNIPLGFPIQRLPPFLFLKAPFKQKMATAKVTAAKDIAIWPKFCYTILTVKKQLMSIFPNNQKKQKTQNFNFEGRKNNFGKIVVFSAKNINSQFFAINFSILKYTIILNFALSILKSRQTPKLITNIEFSIF